MYYLEKDMSAKYVISNTLPTIVSNKAAKVDTSSHF